MNAPDSTRLAVNRDDTCVVCGKDTTGGRGFMNLSVENRVVPLCCPMCYEVYQKDPARYLGNRRAREIGGDVGLGASW